MLERFESKPEVVVESTFNWCWLVDGLLDAGYSTKRAHVLGLATLARLLRVQAIPEAHIYPRTQRATRDVLRRRLSLVRLRAEELGSIRRMLYRLLQLPGVADILALTIMYESGPIARSPRRGTTARTVASYPALASRQA